MLLLSLQVVEGITRALGPWIWEHAVLGLTHGRMTALPPGYTFGALLAPATALPCLHGLPAQAKASREFTIHKRSTKLLVSLA